MSTKQFYVMNAGGSYFAHMPGEFVRWVQHIGQANSFQSFVSAEYCREKYKGSHIVEV